MVSWALRERPMLRADDRNLAIGVAVGCLSVVVLIAVNSFRFINKIFGVRSSFACAPDTAMASQMMISSLLKSPVRRANNPNLCIGFTVG